jgi:hypothetical protein
MRMFDGILLFPKGLLGGVSAAIFTWVVILCVWVWQLSARRRKMGLPGPFAVAGGWAYLLHQPMVVFMIAIGFGLGFYFSTRP